MQIFLNDFGINQIRSSAYHPQTNGACEHFNGTLKSMLRSLTEKFPDSWDTAFPWILFAYREVPVETLGCSPSDLLFGRSVMVLYLSSSSHGYRRHTSAAPNRMSSSLFLAPVSDSVMLSTLLRSTRRKSVLEQNAGMNAEHVSGRSSHATKSLFCFLFQAIRYRQSFVGPMSWNSNLFSRLRCFDPGQKEDQARLSCESPQGVQRARSTFRNMCPH